jgi:signal transduction histidine kinase
MNGIIGLTALLLDDELNDEQRENLDLIKLSADYLLNIINDILDFSKVEAGMMTIEKARFDLRSNLISAIKPIELRAQQKGLQFRVEFSPVIPRFVLGDATRLSQVVINLLSNAIKFTERGEIALVAEGEWLDQSSLRLHFMIRDTGIGIAENKQSLVFQPFAQADASTTRKYGGTGLGLSICAHIVEVMGGKMWVNSRLGGGSVFHFTAVLQVPLQVPFDVPESSPPALAELEYSA